MPDKEAIAMVYTESECSTAATLRIQPRGDHISAEPSEAFVQTDHIREITDHAMAYAEVGYPVHFAGPAGVGKTTLAFHVASKLGRPVVLIHGDDEFSSSDLVGRDNGYRRSRCVDNFIHSVTKTQEELQNLWVDNRLTTACQEGHTLIYDEFNRSRPEANNALLSILSEKILNLPRLRDSGQGYLEVHPEFRAIFTSNPEEYAGTHKTQDALMDRLITISLPHLDRETEIGITRSKSGISPADAETIVDIVRELRGVGVKNHRPTVRASVAIARVLVHRKAHARLGDPVLGWVCRDVLSLDTAKVTHDGESLMPQKIEEVVQKVCGQAALRPARGTRPVTTVGR
jgi:gas vesicle protein GvpN